MTRDVRFGHRPSQDTIDTNNETRTTPPTLRRHKKPPKTRPSPSAVLLDPSLSPHQRPRPLSSGRADRFIETGAAHGHLTVLKARRNIDGVLHYSARCDCRRRVWVSAAGLRLRRKTRAGCLVEDCAYTPHRLRPWLNFKSALWLQWSELVQRFSGDLHNDWGGSLVTSWPAALDGCTALEAFIEAQPQTASGFWWLQRIDKNGPWADFNVLCCDRPSPELFPRGELSLSYSGAIMSVSEWAQTLGLSKAQVRAARERFVGDAAVEHLLSEEFSRT